MSEVPTVEGLAAVARRRVDHRRRRGGPRDLVRRVRVRGLPRRQPGRRHRAVPRGRRLTLGILAWRAGTRGVVGSVQDAAVAVLALVATATAAKAHCWSAGAPAGRSTPRHLPHRRRRDPGRDGPAAASSSWCSGRSGWATWSGSCRTRSSGGSSPAPDGCSSRAASTSPRACCRTSARSTILLRTATSSRAGFPAFAFGAIMLLAVRLVKKPLVIPTVLGIGLVVFAIGMLVTGSSIDERAGGAVAARTVRCGPAVAAVDVPRAHRRRLVGGARAVGRDRDGGVRGRDRDLVQHLRDRGRVGPGPGHERGAPRRRGAERGLRRPGRDPRVPRAQPDRARRAHERGRADGRADRRARSRWPRSCSAPR